MHPENNILSEKNIHLVFDVSLWVKGLFALSEIIAGVAAHFISQQFLLSAVQWITQNEFVEDPRDIIANLLLHSVQNLSVGARNFAAIYLLGHGIIKLWLIVGLLRKKLWYYPLAMIVFGLFIAYQLYRFTFTHSILLILITLLDLAVIGLTWHEYRYLHHARNR